MNTSLRANWLFPPEAHVALYYLRHPKPPANATQTPHSLTAGKIYHHEVGTGWKSFSNCPWVNYRTIVTVRAQGVLDFLTKIHCTDCRVGTCALFMADRFIAMLRGVRDHEVINETLDSYGNGCVTNIVADRLSLAKMEWQHADMVASYLSCICKISDTTNEYNLSALRYLVPDGVRIEVPTDQVQNSHSMYNVAGNGRGNGRLQKGLAIYTNQTTRSELDKLQDNYGRLTSAEELGVMLFFPGQENTVKLHPNVRWGQMSDVGPSGTMLRDKSDIGLGGI